MSQKMKGRTGKKKEKKNNCLKLSDGVIYFDFSGLCSHGTLGP